MSNINLTPPPPSPFPIDTGPDTFVYVNATLMLVMSAMFIKDLIMLYVVERADRENDERIKTCTLIVQGVLGTHGD